MVHLRIEPSKLQSPINKGYTYRIISEPDCGMYDALNKGVALAQGEIIGQINSDDWYENNALQRVVETYEKESLTYFGQTSES